MSSGPTKTIRKHDEVRSAFRMRWRLRHSPRHVHLYLKALDWLGPDAHIWIREFEEEDLAADEERRKETKILRRRIKRASPLFLSFCEAEGLDPFAMAYGILPVCHVPFDGDGPPWISSGHAGVPQILSRARALPSKRRRSAWLRSATHELGPVFVTLYRGTIDIEARRGPFLVRSNGMHGSLKLRAELPEAPLVSAKGKPIHQLIEHPYLGAGDFKITSASQEEGVAALHFDCQPVPFSLEDRAYSADCPQQQVGRDLTLPTGAEELNLVIRCLDHMRRNRLPISVWTVLDLLDTHVRTLNLMCPPWVEPLSRPRESVVEAACRRRSLLHGVA